MNLHPSFCSAPALAALILLSGCTTAAPKVERDARARLAEIGAAYRPTGRRPELPVLNANSSLEDFMRFGVLNHPAVEAAFHDWRASIAAITPARSLPDPQFTFEADVADTLMTFMPGVMFDFMAPSKRLAMANEAAARSGVAYRAYVAAVLRAAAGVRKAWVELAFVEDMRRVYEASIRNVDQSLALAENEFSTGRGMVSFDQMVRLKNLIAEHHAHHAAFADRLVAAQARFKSALGIAPEDLRPVWPTVPLAPTRLPPEAELWQSALALNPEIGSMRAMVDMAIAEIEVARKAGTPDLALGVMADLKASPLMVRPAASVTLPIWRDKIAGQIAAAEARRDAAAARVSAEQLNVAAELAQMLFMVRDADRMIAYIDGTALPNLERVVASAQAGYQSGMGQVTMIPEARHMALTMQLERVKALREREMAVADLLTLIAGHAPAGASLLAQAAAESR